MLVEQKKKEIVSYFLKNKVLVTSELLNKLSSVEELERIYSGVKSGVNPLDLISKKLDIEKVEKDDSVKVVFDYKTNEKKRTIQDFIGYFNARFKVLEKMLQTRSELFNLTSIGRLINKTDKENLSIIGMVYEKNLTRNGNLILELEDNTGSIKVIVSKNKKDVFDVANDLVLDEVVGIYGGTGTNVLFANKIISPDIPINTEIKKSPDEVYAMVLPDLHYGSIDFLEAEFNKFLKWINQEIGSEDQKEIASKVKYIFIVGDLVSGIGIYPGMENNLLIKDIYQQFELVTELLKKIPSNIKLIICPGNHDPGRIAEPQTPIPKEYSSALWEMPNVIMLGNPSMVNIHSSENFPGFDVLLYHGFSYTTYSESVPSIKNSGTHLSSRGAAVMKFLLQKRHLAPSHKSTTYIPDPEQDPLLITKVPDIFVSGHIHTASIESYRGVQIICGSCWEGQTAFQDKMGHVAEPCRVPIINLQTREMKMMRF